MAQRQVFSSNFAAILTIAGAAIGLGNVWRFPYMMGAYGGSAFLLVYLIFMILFAIPALMGEWSLGREAGGGTIRSFTHALGPKWGRLIGYLLIFGIIMANSYYLVIIGNVAYSTYFSVVYGFDAEAIGRFTAGLTEGSTQYLITTTIVLAIIWVALNGLNKGIEKISNIIVPFFFLVIVYLIYSTFQLEGSVEKMRIFLQPDFTQITWKTLFAALGQAVFSVGLGGTVMLVYGSYLRPDAPMIRTAFGAAFADAGAALMAALFVFPTILVFGLDPESGPRLLFETLPSLFGQMDAGRVLGSFFMLAFFLIAFLSGLAAFEVIVSSVSDDAPLHGLNRKKCIFIFGAVEIVVMALPAFNPDIIGSMDLIFGTGMLAFGCTMSIIALTWFISRQKAMVQLALGRFTPPIYLWLKWVLPVVFFIIIVGFIFSWGA